MDAYCYLEEHEQDDMAIECYDFDFRSSQFFHRKFATGLGVKDGKLFNCKDGDRCKLFDNWRKQKDLVDKGAGI